MSQRYRRNAIHLATGLAAAWVLLVPPPWTLTGLLIMLTVPLLVDLWRWRGGQPAIDRLLPGVFHEREPLGISGATLLAVGYLLAFLLFPPLAAAAGILALAVGDPAAAVAGRWYGHRRNLSGKTWVGSLACFLTCLPIIWLLPGLNLPAATAGAAMAALVERRAGALDNLLIPVAVAMLLKLWVL